MDTDITEFYKKLFKTKGKIRLTGEYKPITKEISIHAVTATKHLWGYHIGSTKNIKEDINKAIERIKLADRGHKI